VAATGTRVTLNGLSVLLNNPFYTGLIRIKRSGQIYQGNHEHCKNCGYTLIGETPADEISMALLRGSRLAMSASLLAARLR
jgi:hypothetical protein